MNRTMWLPSCIACLPAAVVVGVAYVVCFRIISFFFFKCLHLFFFFFCWHFSLCVCVVSSDGLVLNR